MSTFVPAATAMAVAATKSTTTTPTTATPVVNRVKEERERLRQLLQQLGAEPFPSQANFVLARFHNSQWVQQGLASLGIAVRSFASAALTSTTLVASSGTQHNEDDSPSASEPKEFDDFLANSLRITCPGDSATFTRLQFALETVLRPQVLLFDMDGVLADVSHSYDLAIIETAAFFGVDVSPEDITRVKACGDANNDWALTWYLLMEQGVFVPLPTVIAHFERLYQGDPKSQGKRTGLRENERLLVSRALLQRLADRQPLGVVTGRPRADAEWFLKTHRIADLFSTVVCKEDAAVKPAPAPVRLALRRLKVTGGWMIGDTPDDMQAARAAGVVPIGMIAPNEESQVMEPALFDAGAARILNHLHELETLFG